MSQTLGSGELFRRRNEVCGWTGTPSRIGLAIRVRLPTRTPTCVVSPFRQHLAAGIANRKRSLPQLKLAAKHTALPCVTGRQLRHRDGCESAAGSTESTGINDTLEIVIT